MSRSSTPGTIGGTHGHDVLWCDQRVPSPEEIVRHRDEGEVVYVGAHPTGYVMRIVEPDPSWPQRYAELEARISAALGDRLLAIQHIGSTSVPGLPAKPIIDIDLAVADPADEAAYAPALESIGLVHWLTEPDWHQHRLFKLLTEPRVHLHVFGPDCPEMVRHQLFRDWLVAHPEDRAAYADAKRSALATLDATGDDHGALGFGMRYNAIKEPVVHDIYQRMFRAAGLL
ncbi:GrpB family protein [Nocardioides sp.]|uniref:GrpB family protein n=1 Tax=Nocardioides sp. TaxID=35761 RepID=UPI0035B1146A